MPPTYPLLEPVSFIILFIKDSKSNLLFSLPSFTNVKLVFMPPWILQTSQFLLPFFQQHHLLRFGQIHTESEFLSAVFLYQLYFSFMHSKAAFVCAVRLQPMQKTPQLLAEILFSYSLHINVHSALACSKLFSYKEIKFVTFKVLKMALLRLRNNKVTKLQSDFQLT